ncbi:uncharacterized protein LOC113374845 [Ctenocephalides felis]|uniref:uncharacterized protein LOC113374845 n=1 Tax=Ctenocephalides felis TaxID=7515 RepID=UPI000E6E3B75|nr:uncharacterized protein LOC113374845 [Ctenocephalides felis]
MIENRPTSIIHRPKNTSNYSTHEERVIKLEAELEELEIPPPERNGQSLLYKKIIRKKMPIYSLKISWNDGVTEECIVAPPIPDRPLPGMLNHRYNRSAMNTLNNMNYHTTNGDGEYPGEMLSRSSDSEHNSLMQQAASNYKLEEDT